MASTMTFIRDFNGILKQKDGGVFRKDCSRYPLQSLVLNPRTRGFSFLSGLKISIPFS
jgi:hypothetical protein